MKSTNLAHRREADEPDCSYARASDIEAQASASSATTLRAEEVAAEFCKLGLELT